MPPHPLLVHGALVLVSLLFGYNYIAVRKVVEAVEPREWMFWRIACATLFLVPIAAIWSRAPHRKGVIPAVLLASALGVIANQIMFAEGMARTLPSHAAVINSQIPLLTLCFAVLARQERFTFAKVLGIVIAISGVLILLRIDELVEGGVPDRRMLLGDLLVLGNATTFSAFLVLMRRIGRDIDPLRATAIGFVFGTVVIGCYSATALSHEGLATLASMPVLPYALFAVLGATVLSYLLNNWALHHTHSSQVALYICLQPVVTTAVSIVQDGHRPEPRFYVAGTLACSGVVVQHVVAAFARRGAAQK